MCSWQKMTSVRFLVRFCKKLWFSVWFRFYKINCSFGFSVRFLHCVLFHVYAPTEYSWAGFELHSSINAVFHLHLYVMTLEMTYFRAELVQLTVSQSDSELEVQRYGTTKNTLTVGRWIVNETWKTVPKPPKSVFWKLNCRNWVFGFLILRSVRFGLVFTKLIWHFHRVAHIPNWMMLKHYSSNTAYSLQHLQCQLLPLQQYSAQKTVIQRMLTWRWLSSLSRTPEAFYQRADDHVLHLLPADKSHHYVSNAHVKKL